MSRMEKYADNSIKKYILYQFIAFVLFILLMEWIMRIAVHDPVIKIFSFGIVPSLLFSISASLLFFSFLILMPLNLHLYYSISSAALLLIVYNSQIFYHDIFRTFYNVQSATNAGQGLAFTDAVKGTVLDNTFWITLCLFLVVLYILFHNVLRRKVKSPTFSKQLKIKGMIICLTGFIFFHGLALISIRTDEQAYDLYYRSWIPNLSVEKLGLFTTVRLDIQRYMTNWSPQLVEPTFAGEKESNDSEENEENIENENIQQEKRNDVEKMEYNALDIDFNALIKEEDNKDIINMHRYFDSIEPSEKNTYTGALKGYNVILLTAEAFAPYAIQEELTPTLYKLSTEGIQFNNFYTPIWGVSTSDGEYVALNSLLPKPGVWSFSESGENDMPFVLGNQLNNLGYETKAYHNHTYSYYDRHLSHPNMGYDYKGVGNGLNVKITWPESDLEMIEKTTDEYINQEAFHAYYMTVSGHLEYNFSGNAIAAKNKQYVDHLALSDQAKAYLATQIELDRALEELLSRLEKEGVLNHTLIVLSSDHYPYGLNNGSIEELTGEKLDEKFGIYQNELILYAEGIGDLLGKTVVEEPASSLDILPTVSNLLGLDYDSRLLMGRDLFSNEEALVIFNDKSFITEKGKYYAPEGSFEPLQNDEGSVDEEYVEKIKNIVDEKFYYSSKILELDYYSHINYQ